MDNTETLTKTPREYMREYFIEAVKEELEVNGRGGTRVIWTKTFGTPESTETAYLVWRDGFMGKVRGRRRVDPNREGEGLERGLNNIARDTRGFRRICDKVHRDILAYIESNTEYAVLNPLDFMTQVDLRLNTLRVVACHLVREAVDRNKDVLTLVGITYPPEEPHGARHTYSSRDTRVEHPCKHPYAAEYMLSTFGVDVKNTNDLTSLRTIYIRYGSEFADWDSRAAYFYSIYRALRYHTTCVRALYRLTAYDKCTWTGNRIERDIVLSSNPKYAAIVSTITDPSAGDYRIVCHISEDSLCGKRAVQRVHYTIVLYQARPAKRVNKTKGTKKGDIVWALVGRPLFQDIQDSRDKGRDNTPEDDIAIYDIGEFGAVTATVTDASYTCGSSHHVACLYDLYEKTNREGVYYPVSPYQTAPPLPKNLGVRVRRGCIGARETVQRWGLISSLQLKYEAGVTIWSRESWEGLPVEKFAHSIEAVDIHPLKSFSYPYVTIVDWEGVYTNLHDSGSLKAARSQWSKEVGEYRAERQGADYLRSRSGLYGTPSARIAVLLKNQYAVISSSAAPYYMKKTMADLFQDHIVVVRRETDAWSKDLARKEVERLHVDGQERLNIVHGGSLPSDHTAWFNRIIEYLRSDRIVQYGARHPFLSRVAPGTLADFVIPADLDSAFNEEYIYRVDKSMLKRVRGSIRLLDNDGRASLRQVAAEKRLDEDYS